MNRCFFRLPTAQSASKSLPQKQVHSSETPDPQCRTRYCNIRLSHLRNRVRVPLQIVRVQLKSKARLVRPLDTINLRQRRADCAEGHRLEGYDAKISHHLMFQVLLPSVPHRIVAGLGEDRPFRMSLYRHANPAKLAIEIVIHWPVAHRVVHGPVLYRCLYLTPNIIAILPLPAGRGNISRKTKIAFKAVAIHLLRNRNRIYGRAAFSRPIKSSVILASTSKSVISR